MILLYVKLYIQIILLCQTPGNLTLSDADDFTLSKFFSVHPLTISLVKGELGSELAKSDLVKARNWFCIPHCIQI